MSQEFSIKTEAARVFVDSWDDGGVWLSMQVRGGSAYTSMTREQAQELLKALTALVGENEVV